MVRLVRLAWLFMHSSTCESYSKRQVCIVKWKQRNKARARKWDYTIHFTSTCRWCHLSFYGTEYILDHFRKVVTFFFFFFLIATCGTRTEKTISFATQIFGLFSCLLGPVMPMSHKLAVKSVENWGEYRSLDNYPYWHKGEKFSPRAMYNKVDLNSQRKNGFGPHAEWRH